MTTIIIIILTLYSAFITMEYIFAKIQIGEIKFNNSMKLYELHKELEKYEGVNDGNSQTN